MLTEDDKKVYALEKGLQDGLLGMMLNDTYCLPPSRFIGLRRDLDSIQM